MALLCALGLIWRIWTDPQTQRQADKSPVIPTRVTRRRDAGNRGDLLAAASAREPSPSTRPATGFRATGRPATGFRATGKSPVIPMRVTRRRDAGDRGDLLATASAREPSPSTRPATGFRATGRPATGFRATGKSPATGTSPAVCPARITRRRDAGRVELPRLADARANPSAREHAPLAAVEAFAELPLSAWCAAQKVLRIRGGGGLGDAGVQPEHKSAPNRQPLLSPAPSDPYREVRGSSSATSTSLPHTLEHRGYTGTEEECSET